MPSKKELISIFRKHNHCEKWQAALCVMKILEAGFKFFTVEEFERFLGVEQAKG